MVKWQARSLSPLLTEEIWRMWVIPLDRAAQRVFPQRLATHRRKPIDAFAAIDGVQGQKDAALRGELEHQGLAKKVCSSGATAGEDSL